ncbi:hypothetical protein L2729_16995 [Shewanella gelidimarina]|uniref:hypothetical protein n=1 Tax=Shewanella gelidimarina TaxID=56813 RepID=UPI00201022A9|nr:hypothetical protein [Shewanella gelidimarina]MCL1059669.1 hypothetical protein [Shewanella gelidimarina]
MTKINLKKPSIIVFEGIAKKTIFKSEFSPVDSTPTPALLRAVEYSNVAGMDAQPVYPFKRYTKPLFTHTKVGNKRHIESLIPQKEGLGKRYFSRDLETAFLVLKDIAQIKENQATIVFGTVSFSKESKARINRTPDHAKAYGKLLRERLWNEPTIIVLESSPIKPEDEATEATDGIEITHAHVITIIREAPESTLKRLRKILKFDNPSTKNAVVVATDYILKQPYTELIELEEEQFGSLPTKEGKAHPYWLGSWRQTDSDEVKRRVPVNIASSDYISKEFGKMEARKRYGFIHFGNLRGLKVKERIETTREFKRKYKSTSRES